MTMHPSQNIPEERVPTILARAAELDRQTITLDALRAAALEAGISATAVDQALEEYVTGGFMRVSVARDVAHKPRLASRLRRWWHKMVEPLELGALAMVMGAAGAIDEPFAALSVVSLIGMTGYLAWRDRGTGRSARFQLATLFMTVAMLSGFTMTGSRDEAFAFVGIAGVALFVLGTMLVHFRSGHDVQGDEVSA